MSGMDRLRLSSGSHPSGAGSRQPSHRSHPTEGSRGSEGRGSHRPPTGGKRSSGPGSAGGRAGGVAGVGFEVGSGGGSGGGSSEARTPKLKEAERGLIEGRLREAYGFGITRKEKDLIMRMHAKGSQVGGERTRKVIGKDTGAVKGQIVRHIDGGKHVAGQMDGDYLSGGLEGVVLDVCGDYAQVRWDNGNVRFYYVGGTPFRPDSNGNDTANPRALRCLVLVVK